MRSRARRLAGALAACAMSAAGAFGTVAQAQSSDACFDAPVEGQKLQRAGKLTAARALFETCSRNTCPAEIVEDCTRWARGVDESLPSVVVAVRDARGRDVVDAFVSVDGAPAVPVSARAMDLDPGAHRFVFRRTSSETIERQVVLREGEKNRELAVAFAGADGAAAAPPSATSDPAGAAPPPAFWIAGGIGVAAMASFAAFGALGVGERSSDDCGNGCPASQKNSVDTKLRIADVSLGVGVVALGVATWVYLSRSHVEAQRTSSVAPAREASSTRRPFFEVNPARTGAVAVIGTRF
jgi:hypothetical protein